MRALVLCAVLIVVIFVSPASAEPGTADCQQLEKLIIGKLSPTRFDLTRIPLVIPDGHLVDAAEKVGDIIAAAMADPTAVIV